MAIQYLESNRATAENDLLEAIQASLAANTKVLLLLSGGSNISSGVATVNPLTSNNLTISLVDERYGDVGHKDSNMTALEASGLDISRFQTIPVLTGKGFNETVEECRHMWEIALEAYDEIYALLGIGTDGHIAGILPRSPALEAEGPIVGYEGPDYKRITLSLQALKQVHHAYVFAFGEAKVPALEALKRQTTSLIEQPSQILHEMPDVRVYNESLRED